MDKESSYSILKLVASMVISIALSILIKKKTGISSDDTSTTKSIDFVHNHIEAEPTNEDLIMALIARMDLKMSKGKTTAQCCHAAVALSSIADKDVWYQWKNNGQPKYVLKCQTQEDLHKIARDALKLGVPTYIIRDAGRTQIPSGSQTVVGIGPAKKELIDEITKELKPY